VKIESLFLFGVGIFFGAIALIYWFLSYDDGGGMMLLGACLLGALPGSYYFFWHRRFMGYKFYAGKKVDRPAVGERPEDRPDATIEDGQGVVNSFPGSSIWPFILGMGAFLIMLALVFGTWFLPIGMGLMLTALIGVTAESRRGGHV